MGCWTDVFLKKNLFPGFLLFFLKWSLVVMPRLGGSAKRDTSGKRK